MEQAKEKVFFSGFPFLCNHLLRSRLGKEDLKKIQRIS
jgi:hypothetical protein